MSEVRVRIAPSPTGDPHVGTAYTALFNYVFAKKKAGKFILRIEDTDQTRFRKQSEKQIMSSLSWLGLSWDEGPDKAGFYGPYRQSERLDIYQAQISHLIKSGHAYRCFCTSDRLKQMREEQQKNKLKFGYDGLCRRLSAEQIAAQQQQNTPSVVRLKVPQGQMIEFQDRIRGEISISSEQLDDQVLMKSDGFPTYHFACVVDDHLMKISHVIRAEEWISSTPKHELIYMAFGWTPPEWIHLPLLRNPDKSKISKRKNPVSIEFYREAGILPDALNNFLALMGFSYGDDVEIYSLEEMVHSFEVKKMNAGSPVFDFKKLKWLNQQYLMKFPVEETAALVEKHFFDPERIKKIIPLVSQRIESIDEFMDYGKFFFRSELDYTGLAVLPKNMEKKQLKKVLTSFAEGIDALDDWDLTTIDPLLKSTMEAHALKPKHFLLPLRLILTGRKDSPPLMETMEVIGRELCRFRVRDYLSSDAFKSA